MKLDILALAVALGTALACSSGSETDDGDPGTGGSTGTTDGGSSGNDAAPAATVEAGAELGAFTGDCTTSRWGDVSEACWACACDLCAETLDTCDEQCAEIIDCALGNECLVDNLTDISCEAACVDQACVAGDPDRQAASGPVGAFDLCLIQNAPADRFRACEEECSVAYSGTVCERYPAP